MAKSSNKASRRKSRQRAVQILYQIDLRSLPPEEALDAFYSSLYDSEGGTEEPERDQFLNQLVHGTVQHVAELDERLQKYAQNWKMGRMSAVDRNVLRLASYELLYTSTPAAVAIDEAIEVARRFSGDEAIGFINGVLDSLRKDLPAPSLAEAEG